MENIGRVFSHVHHRCILGFKALFLAVTDGTTQMLLDFALLGEKGKDGKFGMSDEENSQDVSPKDVTAATPCRSVSVNTRQKKTDLMIAMIRRAIRKGVRFRYVLADSWFACKDVIRFIRSRHVRCDYLGMIKVGRKQQDKILSGREALYRAGLDQAP